MSKNDKNQKVIKIDKNQKVRKVTKPENQKSSKV